TSHRGVYEEPPLTQLELERRFFELCKRAGIPRPLTQAPIELGDGDMIYADFVWFDSKRIVRTAIRRTARARPSSATAAATAG
ncbi:MAG: hypothetical protein ACREX8_06345, partial [Gammaproteobacteria bacterium]